MIGYIYIYIFGHPTPMIHTQCCLLSYIYMCVYMYIHIYVRARHLLGLCVLQLSHIHIYTRDVYGIHRVYGNPMKESLG